MVGRDITLRTMFAVIPTWLCCINVRNELHPLHLKAIKARRWTGADSYGWRRRRNWTIVHAALGWRQGQALYAAPCHRCRRTPSHALNSLVTAKSTQWSAGPASSASLHRLRTISTSWCGCTKWLEPYLQLIGEQSHRCCWCYRWNADWLSHGSFSVWHKVTLLTPSRRSTAPAACHMSAHCPIR